MSVAYCFRSGQVGVARKVPPGSIALVSGPSAELRHQVEAKARHARIGTALMVPGAPEAADDDAALDAAAAWAKWMVKNVPVLTYLGAV
jgi:hypothetical protein